MLELKLFGTGTAYYYEKPLLRFPGHQSFLLLCYLLLNREHTQSRERLATVFWGDYPTNTSLKYLRNVLWRLRNVFQKAGAEFDDYIQVDDDSIAFQKTCRYQLDVEAFEARIIPCQDIPAEKLSADQANLLSQAVDLYGGDLLEGVDGEWCLYERERLSLLHLNTLLRLMVYCRAHQAYRRGLEYGDQILALDNTRETVHREMMLLHWLSGEPAQALAQYKRCEQILYQQVGVQLSEETQQMYRQMLNHQFVPPSPDALAEMSEVRRSPEPENVTEYAIQRLRHLQSVIEQTSSELHYLEEVLKQSRGNCQ